MSTGDEYENWDEERDEIIEDTLDALAGQEDENQELVDSGSYVINAQLFAEASNLVVGPVLFTNAFTGPPKIVFGQAINSNQIDATVSQFATNVVPFIVQPYVVSFNFTGAQTDGFYLGLYALTKPVDNVSQHTIYWTAHGSGSRYVEEQETESWTEVYDFNEPDYITEEVYSEDEF